MDFTYGYYLTYLPTLFICRSLWFTCPFISFSDPPTHILFPFSLIHLRLHVFWWAFNGLIMYSLFCKFSLVSYLGVGAGILWVCKEILSRLLVREYHGAIWLRFRNSVRVGKHRPRRQLPCTSKALKVVENILFLVLGSSHGKA